MIKHWTPEEEQTLTEMKSQGFKLADIADRLGRSLEAVKTRSKRLKAQSGQSKNLGWTDAEVEKLREDLDYDELVLLLGRTRRSIMSKCEKLGISKRFPGSQKSSGTMKWDKPTTLYLADFGDFKKVGITQVSLEERMRGEKSHKILDSVELSLDEAMSVEQEILRNMREFRVIGDIRRGSAECFRFNGTLLEELL